MILFILNLFDLYFSQHFHLELKILKRKELQNVEKFDVVFNHRKFSFLESIEFFIFLYHYRSQLSPEPSILQGFEDEIIVESSRKKATSTLPDLLLSSNFGGTVPSKSAPTPRVYFENKSKLSD